MPNDSTPQNKINPGDGTELLLVIVGSVLLVVTLVAAAATAGIALIVLALAGMTALPP